MQHARNANARLSKDVRHRLGPTLDNQTTTNALIADLFRVIAEEEDTVRLRKYS